jgi:hypothetical protein
MLEKYTRTTTDIHGCEFHYTMCGVYENDYDLEKKKGFRNYSEKIYICEEFSELRAHSLKDLKRMVASFTKPH